MAQEQALLEAGTRLQALTLLHDYLTHEVQVLELRRKISSKVETEMSKQQRDYMLRQQMQAIQQELGEQSPEKAEVDELRRQVMEADLPAEVRKEAERELTRLERLPSAAPDYQVTRSYLELLLELPWKKTTVDVIDLVHTRRILDEDHFGLEEVKERILESLAVLKLNPGAKAPILCLVGPPGVGKTSLGQSISRRWGGSSSASAWAECTTRRSCAAIGGPTSAPCPAGCCKPCGGPASTTRCYTFAERGVPEYASGRGGREEESCPSNVRRES